MHPDNLAEAAARRALAGHVGSALSSTLYLHQQLGLVDDLLQYFDRASMAKSLELRVPFLDHHVVEFCAGVPNDLKVDGLEGKRLLRTAARGLIPERIIDKKKVGFFSHAVGSWFTRQLGGPVTDHLVGRDPAYAAYVDPTRIRELVARHEASPGGSVDPLLLRTLMLEVWLTSFVPRAFGPRAPLVESATA
jgi:asparagine synthase (glutamine-hydrolysing)